MMMRGILFEGLPKWKILRSILMAALSFLLVSFMLVSAEKRTIISTNSTITTSTSDDLLAQFLNFFWQSDQSGYHHVWPDMKFGWRIVVGSIIGFCGAAFGSVGGVGGGGIFVPMLSLVIGFDPKSATAISKFTLLVLGYAKRAQNPDLFLRNSKEIVDMYKFLVKFLMEYKTGMIMGSAASSVYYNLKLRHPTLDMPIIDYDLALLFQPMLMLGISIGVTFNVIFADWMVTVLLIVLFIGTSMKAFFKGIETWRKETMIKLEETRRLASNGVSDEALDYKPLPGGSNMETKEIEVSSTKNLYRKELGLLIFVWVAFLVLQIIKEHISTCSTAYWILDLLQVPVAVGVSLYEAVGLYKGRRIISSKGNVSTTWKVHQLVLYCCCGILAGIVGGLLGLGGGFILCPLFLELGVPPQVSSATATFAMAFSASMSVVEYYLLKRFPVPYALYFMAVATFAAFVGQHLVRKLIIILGRASFIIFILAFAIFISAVSLGGAGISNMVGMLQRNDYMGFENLCKYKA